MCQLKQSCCQSVVGGLDAKRQFQLLLPIGGEMRDITALIDTWEGSMKRIAILSRSPSQGKIRLVHQAALTALICAVAVAASAQTTPTEADKEATKAAKEAEKQAAKEAGTPQLAVALIGPARELKFAEYTWFRFGAQVQAWFKAAQDRIKQPDGSDGSFAYDFYCRRCRFFVTGSVIKNVFFNILFESSNTGKADPVTGVKNSTIPQILDAYGQVKFVDWFWLSGGQILMPLTRNGLQPTTTYVSIDTANIATTPAAQGNTFVLRDLGFQANGFFLENHLEYRVGVFQGTRQGSIPTASSSHNGPRLVAMVSANFWDPETGYVNGGHYYGTKKVVGVMANFDYQTLRKAFPPAAGVDKNAYYGVSGAAFINYPLSGSPSPRGGDEIVGLLQFGYYDGGARMGATPNPGSYPAIPKQTNYLAELGYYNHAGRFSVFGKVEARKISDDYDLLTVRAPGNQLWMAGGVKYYVGPVNFMNFGLQYERVQNYDAPSTQQKGTHNITFQMQTLLY